MIPVELYQKVQQLIVEGSADDVIGFLLSITKPAGPIHPTNEGELAIWNIAGFYYLRDNYKEAERLYTALYELLLKFQNDLGRVHKGMVLQNLALSLFNQGRISDAIDFFVSAYVEDIISLDGKEIVDKLPASNMLRGFCGVPQEDLNTIRGIILEMKSEKVPLNPKTALSSEKLNTLILLLKERYLKYTPDIWKWNLEGQVAFKNSDYKTSFRIYHTWFMALLEYQKRINARVHKGHPLYNAGISVFLDGKQKEAFEIILVAYVEDVITALNLGDADSTDAFKFLAVSEDIVRDLKKIEEILFALKKQKSAILDPRETLTTVLATLYPSIKKQSEAQWATIMSAQEEKDKALFERISQKREIDEQTNNTLYILKRWNSATPSYPLADESFGGGYFLVWNKLGIAIDPGYDFLELLYREKFYPRNIDLVIITHAHDDHCCDLEALFSTLHKLSQGWVQHKIDLIVSEGAYIKYGRLLAISEKLVQAKIMKQNDDIDPSKLSGKTYELTVHATRTQHNERPWMENNTGYGLLLTLNNASGIPLRIGLTSDTKYFDGIDQQFPKVDLLIEHIGKIGISENHLCHIGCMELAAKCNTSPKLIIVSEFGEEQKGMRETICRIIESTINAQSQGLPKIPVLAADIGLTIRLPELKIYCRDTKQFEPYVQVIDKEVDGKVIYLKRE